MEMKKVKAHRPNLDEEKIKKLFIDTNHIKSREVYDGFKCREFGQYAIVNYTGKQGEQLFYEPSNVEYSHPNIDYILNCLFTDPQFSSYNLDLYSQTENLSFASKKEIFHKVKMMFASLDVPVSEQYTCYALNHETLQKEEKPMDSARNRVEKAKKQKWTKEDDAYYFVLHQEINGIPITQLPYGDGYEGTGIELTELSAIYGKRGWISFTENWGYNLEETEEKEKGYFIFWIKRCDKKTYVISKIINCFLSAFFLLTTGMFSWIISLRIFLPWINGSSDQFQIITEQGLGYLLKDGHYLLYYCLYCIGIGMMAGILSVGTFTLSLFIEKQSMVILTTAVLFYLNVSYLGSISASLDRWSMQCYFGKPTPKMEK